MSQDLLEYPKLMERAVRGVVREALAIAAEHGLPGLHHFYITFETAAPGVSIPDHLAARYPDEMTIVLENQFWDLSVDDDGFAVSLSFTGAQERLVVPFAAITAFVDPSVKFGLQFGEKAAAAQAAAATEAPAGGDAAPGDEGDAAAPDDAADDGRVVPLDDFRKK